LQLPSAIELQPEEEEKLNRKEPSAASRNQKRKSRFDHEGHEEHEVYEKKYPNPSWPS